MLTIKAVTALISTVVNCSSAHRRGGREAEGGGLLNRYTGQNLYRGFESLPLRQMFMAKGLWKNYKSWALHSDKDGKEAMRCLVWTDTWL